MDSTNKSNSAGHISSGLYEKIRSDILSGDLYDGSKLTEKSICERYDVSRTPVREALFRLAAEGLVEIVPNRGAFVRGLSGRDISDILELRTLLEIQAAEWAIERMSSEEIDSLSEALDLMELYTLREDAERLSEFDREFHRLIYEGTKDRMIIRSLEMYKTCFDDAMPPAVYTASQLKEIFDEHRMIFIAFESRNMEAGKAAMRAHMENTRLRRIKGGIRE